MVGDTGPVRKANRPPHVRRSLPNAGYNHGGAVDRQSGPASLAGRGICVLSYDILTPW
jgi:hypothetical protein